MKGRKYLLLLFLLLLFCSFPVSAFAMGDGDEGNVALLTTVPPSITSGANGVFAKGSSTGLTFGTNASKSDFEAVLVDGKEIGSGNYTVSGEPLSVTLKASFLQTLSVGTHTISIRTSSGTAEANFSVKGKQSGDPATRESDTPATGDSSNMLLWTALLSVSAGACVTIILADRHKRFAR